MTRERFECADGTRGRIAMEVHRGAIFRVYQATLDDGRVVALKVPADHGASGGDALYGAFANLVFTRLFSVVGSVGRSAGALPAGATLHAKLLEHEAARIVQSQGSWNHAVIHAGPTTWMHGDAVPSLVTPWLPGDALGALDVDVQCAMFPRMVPSLWDALAAAPHSDLHPGHLILAPARDRFALIDPGAAVYLDQRRSSGDGDVALVFATNVEHYPVLPPYYASTRLGVRPRAHFEAFLNSEGGFSMSIGPDADTTIPTMSAVNSILGGAPRAADLLALGVMYYRMLTRRHPFYEDEESLPAWYGVRINQGRGHAPPHALAMFERTIALPREIARSVSDAQQALCMALLGLTATTRAELTTLAHAAAS
jgi:hypothetical protein